MNPQLKVGRAVNYGSLRSCDTGERWAHCSKATAANLAFRDLHLWNAPLLAQVALSKEFSGTWRSHASSNSRPKPLEYRDFFFFFFWGGCRPWAPLLAVMCLNYWVQARWERSENLLKNSRLMAMGEVAVGGWMVWEGEAGGGRGTLP